MRLCDLSIPGLSSILKHGQKIWDFYLTGVGFEGVCDHKSIYLGGKRCVYR